MPNIKFVVGNSGVKFDLTAANVNFKFTQQHIAFTVGSQKSHFSFCENKIIFRLGTGNNHWDIGIHTHVEADITDLDKYTKAEVDLSQARQNIALKEHSDNPNAHHPKAHTLITRELVYKVNPVIPPIVYPPVFMAGTYYREYITPPDLTGDIVWEINETVWDIYIDELDHVYFEAVNGDIYLYIGAKDKNIPVVTENDLKLLQNFTRLDAHEANRNPHGMLKGGDDWTSIQYYENDTALENGYFGKALQDTTDHLAPTPVGVEFWQIPEVPVWVARAEIASIFSGVNLDNLTLTYEISQLRIWIPNIAANVEYRVLVINNITNTSSLGGMFTGDFFTEIGWNTVNITEQFITPGANIDFVLIAVNVAGNTAFNHPWTYTSTSNQDLDPGIGNVNRRGDHTVIRISATERNGITDRHAELVSVVDGTVIKIADEANFSAYLEYEVLNGWTDNIDWVSYNVVLVDTGAAGEPAEGVDVQVYFEVPIAASTDYVELTDHFVSNISLKGVLKIGEGARTLTDHAYGMDILVQNYTSSSDWKILAHSQSVSGGIDEGGGLDDAPSDGSFYGRKDALWVNPLTADIADFPNTMPPSAHTHIHAALTDLAEGNDDHPQYLTPTRGNSRYPQFPSLNTALTSADDLDTIIAEGWYRWGSPAPVNSPDNKTYGIMFVGKDVGQVHQLVWAYVTTGESKHFFRRRSNNAFSGWSEAANMTDIPTSLPPDVHEHDADYVKKIGDTMTGDLVLNAETGTNSSRLVMSAVDTPRVAEFGLYGSTIAIESRDDATGDSSVITVGAGISFRVNSGINSIINIENTVMYSTVDFAMDLGSIGKRWGNVYARSVILSQDATAAMEAVTKQQMEADFVDRFDGPQNNGYLKVYNASTLLSDITWNSEYAIKDTDGITDLPLSYSGTAYLKTMAAGLTTKIQIFSQSNSEWRRNQNGGALSNWTKTI